MTPSFFFSFSSFLLFVVVRPRNFDSIDSCMTPNTAARMVETESNAMPIIGCCHNESVKDSTVPPSRPTSEIVAVVVVGRVAVSSFSSSLRRFASIVIAKMPTVIATAHKI